ncbi:MAG TPA: hypothetical protein VEG30_08055 [Terriglobales bacterium]|nr:hypothetical protein [Terriglobales bacterium]
MSGKKAALALLILTAIVTAAALLLPRLPQPQSYHDFADQRSWLGVPNFGNVISNIAFAIIGLFGLKLIFGSVRPGEPRVFVDSREKWPYAVMCFGLFLTAFGSAYYHLAPDNTRLVWDRLPMTIVFAALVAALIAERISLAAGLWLLPVLLAIGGWSVFQWWQSELRGAGDLRFYVAVQAYAVLVVLLMLVVPGHYTRRYDFGFAVGFYLLAKILETFDRQVFVVRHIVSGHTLKHLAAAAGGWWILRMISLRRPILVNINDAPTRDAAHKAQTVP